MTVTAAPDIGSLIYRLMREHRYALVAAEHLDQLPAGVATHALAGGALADSAELMPCLIALTELRDGQRAALTGSLEEAAAAGQTPVLSALLDSDASAQRLRSHLSVLQLRTSLAGQRGWLRIHDPRVWIQLPRVLGNADWSNLFGPVTCWSVCVGGEWLKTAPKGPPSGRTRQSPMDTAQWAALQRIGAVNRVLTHNQWTTHDDAMRHSLAIDALVARAQQRHGLSRTAELVAYAVLGMRLHPRFDECDVALRALHEQEQICGHVESESAGDSDSDHSVIDALSAITAAQWATADFASLDRHAQGATP